MFSPFPSRFAAPVAALVVGLATGGLAHGQDVLNGIAAVVNDDVITFSQVRELVAAKELAARKEFQGEQLVEKIKEIRLQAINDLIDRQLILQEFKSKGFQIPDYFIDDRVNTIIREEFGGDRQAFLRTIEAQGYTVERFKTQEKEKIIVQEMTRQAVKSNVIVPETKIQEFYKANIAEYSTDEEIKLRMMSIRKAGASSTKRKLVEEIREKIVNGAEFGDMAHLYSDDSSQEKYGDWGWINQKTLNEDLTKAAFSLKPGEVSKVVEIGETYYLMLVEARKPGTQRPLKEIRDEIEKRVQQQDRQKLRAEWLAKLRKKAFIKMY